MKKWILLITLIVPLLVLATMSTAASDGNLVVNGSFEDPVVTRWDICADGDCPGWSVDWYDYTGTPGCVYPPIGRPETANLELHSLGLGWGSAYHGDQWVELDSDWFGPDVTPFGVKGDCVTEPSSIRIYQDIQTCPGGEYRIHFAFSSRTLQPPYPENKLGVYWGGSEVVVLAPPPGTPFGFQPYQYDVTASSDTTRIEFIDLSFPDSYGTLLDDVRVTELSCPPIEVPVDIKPQSCPNPFNVGKKGTMPVAILGTADLDVTLIDPATVLLEGVAPLRWSLEDVSTPYEPYTGKTDKMDCNELRSDGYTDLTLKFDMQELVAAVGGVSDRDEIVLTLTANLHDGTQIIGEDVVWIIKK